MCSIGFFLMQSKEFFSYLVINVDPIALRLGTVQIHWYGMAYVLALSVGLWATLRYADRLGVPRDKIWNMFWLATPAGLIGARLYYVIQQPDLVDHYIKQPINIIAVWEGGMAFFGAIFLAAPVAALYARHAGLTLWLGLDIGAFFGMVGQMFGRLGNLVNGDIVGYAAGHPTVPANVCSSAPCIAYVSDPHVLPWATAYLNPASFAAERGVPYQPAAFYEILINILALLILWRFRLLLPQRVRAGAFFCLYVAFYAVGQFFLFFARDNVFVSFLGVTTLKQAQWTAIFTFLLVIPFYFLLVRRFGRPWADQKQPAPEPDQPQPVTAE